MPRTVGGALAWRIVDTAAVSARVRRVTALANAAVRRLQKAGLVRIGLVVGALAAVAAGVVDRLTSSLSLVEAAVLILACLLALGLVRRRRTIRILPFVSLAARDAGGGCDQAAASFAEHLDLELRRIGRFSSDGVLALAPDLYARVAIPRDLSGRRGRFERQRLVNSGPAEPLAPSEVGSVTLGPLQMPLGWLLRLASRALAQVIQGSVHVSGQKLVVVAQHSGGEKWKGECDLSSEDPTARIPEVARVLAARIAVYIDGEEADAGGALRALTDGLEHLDRYRRRGGPDDLQRAEEMFAAAVADSPILAVAHYDLGIAQDERRRSSGRVEEPARGAWERALQIDPELADAQLALARCANERGNYDEAARRCRQALDRLRGAGRATFAARYQLAVALFRIGERDEHSGRGARCRRLARRQLGLARREVHSLVRIERVAGVAMSERDLLDRELAELAVARALVCESLAGSGSGPRARLTRWRAERAWRAARRVRPQSSSHRASLARTLAECGRPDPALDEALLALRLDRFAPEGRDALREALQSAGGNEEPAALVALSALDVDPFNQWEWLTAARLVAKLGHTRAALELAGVALAHDPFEPTCWELLADCYRDLGDLEASAAYERRFAPPEDGSSAASVHPAERWARTWMLARTGVQGTPEDHLAVLDDLARSGRPETRLAAHELGRLYLAAGRTDRAIEWFERTADGFAATESSSLVGFESMPVDWVLDRADAYRLAEFWQRASVGYSEILERPMPRLTIELGGEITELPPEADAPAVRARAHAGRAEAALNRHDLDQAVRDSADAIQLEPREPFPYLTQAEVLASRGQRDEAISRWRWLIEHAPYYAPLASGRIADTLRSEAAATGDEERKLELLRQAVSAYRAALRPHESVLVEPPVRVALSECLAKLGEQGESLTELERAAGRAGDDASFAWIHGELAVAYERAGRVAEAEECLRQAWRVTADAWERRLREEEREHARLASEASDAANNLAWFLTQQDLRLGEADRVARRAMAFAAKAHRLESGAANRELLAACGDTLGWARYRLGDWDGAIKRLEHVVQAAPNSERRKHLALALESRAKNGEDPDRAIADRSAARRQWSTILELDPGDDLADEAREHQGDFAPAD